MVFTYTYKTLLKFFKKTPKQKRIQMSYWEQALFQALLESLAMPHCRKRLCQNCFRGLKGSHLATPLKVAQWKRIVCLWITKLWELFFFFSSSLNLVLVKDGSSTALHLKSLHAENQLELFNWATPSVHFKQDKNLSLSNTPRTMTANH